MSIRLPKRTQVLQREHRPPADTTLSAARPIMSSRYYASFSYQAGAWDKKRRVSWPRSNGIPTIWYASRRIHRHQPVAVLPSG